MRQVLHNIFKNAAEAAESDGQPSVTVATGQTETEEREGGFDRMRKQRQELQQRDAA